MYKERFPARRKCLFRILVGYYRNHWLRPRPATAGTRWVKDECSRDVFLVGREGSHPISVELLIEGQNVQFNIDTDSAVERS